MTIAVPARLWLDTGRVRHTIGLDTISNDLAGWIANDLVTPGLLAPGEFERVFVEVVESLDRDPDVVWTAFYRNTLDALARGGDPGGTNAGMAPVHARAIELAVGRHVVELGCCFGFLALQLATAGHRVTAVDLVPGAARLLASVAPRLWPRPEVRNSPTPHAQLADADCATRRHGLRNSRGKVDAVVGDAAAVPLADGCADTVYAVHLLEHLPAALAPRVLAEMVRVARRRVVVAVPFEDEPDPIWGHVRTFDLADLHALGAGHRARVERHHGGWLVLDR